MTLLLEQSSGSCARVEVAKARGALGSLREALQLLALNFTDCILVAVVDWDGCRKLS